MSGSGDRLDAPLLLTDDEVVALATSAGRPWPGGLPTVAIDEGSLVAAGFRGNRSLFVRGLIDDEGIPPKAATVLAGEGHIHVYLADDEFAVASWGLSTSHHPAGDGGRWIFESVSAVGVHTLVSQAAEENRVYLEAILQAAFEKGPSVDADVSGSATQICVIAVRRDESFLVTARLGSIVGGSADVGLERPLPRSGTETLNASKAVTELMRVATGGRAST